MWFHWSLTLKIKITFQNFPKFWYLLLLLNLKQCETKNKRSFPSDYRMESQSTLVRLRRSLSCLDNSERQKGSWSWHCSRKLKGQQLSERRARSHVVHYLSESLWHLRLLSLHDAHNFTLPPSSIESWSKGQYLNLLIKLYTIHNLI